jgi:hypothetical protein
LQAERPVLRPYLARGCLRFPVSARRHRLQAPFWRASLRRQKSRSKLEEGRLIARVRGASAGLRYILLSTSFAEDPDGSSKCDCRYPLRCPPVTHIPPDVCAGRLPAIQKDR